MWTSLKDAIAQVIKTNGNQEITGAIMQATLTSIVDQVGANATFKGEAIPTTNPGIQDGPVFYIAKTAGTYSNFGGIVITDKISIITNSTGSWTSISLSYFTSVVDNKVSKTGNETIAGVKTFSSSPIVPTPTSGTDVVNKDYADTKVSKTGNETIAGVKTFSSPPLIPTATAAGEAINKGQLDSAIAFKPTTSQGNVLFAGATNNILGDSNLFWDNAQKFFGIGGVPTATFSIKTIFSQEAASRGSELLTASGWTTVGWTGDFANGFTHTAGNINDLTYPVPLVNGGRYQLLVIITERTAGSVICKLGGETLDSTISTRAWGVVVRNINASLTISPSSDFNGKCVISVKMVTGAYSSVINITNSSGLYAFQIRNSYSPTNTFIGNGSGRYNIEGYDNTTLGALSFYNNINGEGNTAVGYCGLYNNINGYRNTAVGNYAMYGNIDGIFNTCLGRDSLYNNQYGSYNAGVGFQSLFNIGKTIPATAIVSSFTYKIISSGNTDFTLIGSTSNIEGTIFVASGVGTGTGTVTQISSSNVGVGYGAGQFIENGTPLYSAINCTYLGGITRAKKDGVIRETVIGYGAVGNGSNTVTLGDSNNTGTFFKSVYAELYAADNATAQSIPTGPAYTKINQFTAGGQTNATWMTVSTGSDNVIVIKPGRYKVEATASTKSGTANVLLKTAIFVGGVKAANVQAERKIINANDTSLISIGGVVNITAANTEIDVRVAHDNAGSVNITCVHCNLNLVYISE